MVEEVKKKKRRVIKHRKPAAAAPIVQNTVHEMPETEHIDALVREVNAAIARRVDSQETQVQPTTSEISPVTIEKPGVAMQPPKPKKDSDYGWLLLIAGIAAIAGGFGLGYLWMQDQRNQFLAFLVIGLFVGGAYLLYRQLKPREKSAVIVVPGSTGNKPKKNTGPANSMNIYAGKDEFSGHICPEKIEFAMVEDTMGQPWQCLNNDQWYFVHIWNIEHEKLVPFVLPDAKYTDPSLLARYLELPAEKKYFKHRPSLMHYVGPAIMAVMVGIGFLVMIILGG